LFWDERSKHGSSELWFPRIGIILDTMSTDKRVEAPTINLDGRAKKLKAVCLQAGFTIVVLIATAGWLYFLARLGLSLATWIFS